MLIPSIGKNSVTLPFGLTPSKEVGSKLPYELLDMQDRLQKELKNYKITSTNERFLGEEFLDYASAILKYLTYRPSSLPGLNPDTKSLLEYELCISLLNSAYFYKETALVLLGRSYRGNTKDALWTTSSSYLKQSLGLCRYLESLEIVDNAFLSIYGDLTINIKLIQQIGVVLLTLSKLRSNMYGNSHDAVLDLDDDIMKELSRSSILYAKLVIGCHDLARKLQDKLQVYQDLNAYLSGLSFLLLSMDQYQKNESGIAIAMLTCSIQDFTNIIPDFKLRDSILSGAKKRDALKTILKRKKSQLEDKSNILKDKKKNEPMLWIILQETLDDCIIPLLVLLRYRYEQTNNNVFFKNTNYDRRELLNFFPCGKTPDVKGAFWQFIENRLQLVGESVQSASTSYF